MDANKNKIRNARLFLRHQKNTDPKMAGILLWERSMKKARAIREAIAPLIAKSRKTEEILEARFLS